MGAFLLEPKPQEYECGACGHRYTTPPRHTGKVITPMHPCHRVGGMSVPLVPVGVPHKIVANEREDYVGKENIQYNEDGRAIMSVTTVRDDGQDCTVYAPVASASVS